jgi:hypothetical protein
MRVLKNHEDSQHRKGSTLGLIYWTCELESGYS